jgi:acetate kinase
LDNIATIVTINNGSSNLKFKVFTVTDPPHQLFKGKITGIGSASSQVIITGETGREIFSRQSRIDSIEKAGDFLINWLKHQVGISSIGHRVVQGGLLYSEPEPVNNIFLDELKKLEWLAPLHLPPSIIIMELFLKAFPAIPQLACFDTWFHHSMPFEARHIAIPRPLWDKGIVRYGFHGLSCEYIMEYLQTEDPSNIEKKIIIAHLGSGCSLTAVRNGAGIDTTMGFTPAGGLIMNTRSGDIDPGIIPFLIKKEKMDAEELIQLFNKQSGMKAISETDHSIDLILEDKSPNAKQSISMFCYQAKKNIGALTAILGGLDILVFTGGIGENEPKIREGICQGLEFLGIAIDNEMNKLSAKQIGKQNSKVSVRVIPTDEEFIIGQKVYHFLQEHKKQHGYIVGA